MQSLIASLGIQFHVLANNDEGFEDLVDQTCECIINIVTRLGTCFKRVHFLVDAQLSKLIWAYPTLFIQITLVAHDDHRHLALIVQLSHPFADTDQRIFVCQIADHETGIEALDIRSNNIGVLLLPSCIPDLYASERVAKQHDMGGAYICASCLDFLYLHWGVRRHVPMSQARLADIHIAKNGDLD